MSPENSPSAPAQAVGATHLYAWCAGEAQARGKSEMSALDARKPTADDLAGIEWWNGLTEQRRAYWCSVARTATPQHAWDYYKLIREVEQEITA